MDRRSFVSTCFALGLSALAGCSIVESNPAQSATPKLLSASLEPLPPVTMPPTVPALVPIQKFPLPGGAISGLPSSQNLMAWTVDDGFDEATVVKYAEFARDTGTRITFFICASAPGWATAAPILRPLVESGQVQIANHTLTHSKLTSLTDAELQDNLMQNHALIQDLFGVDARPFYRPPFGVRDARTDAAAAAIGYTVPVMWYGSLSDSGYIEPSLLLEFANKWFLPEHIVIGHANQLPVTEVFPQLVDLLNERSLVTVTLNDVYEV